MARVRAGIGRIVAGASLLATSFTVVGMADPGLAGASTVPAGCTEVGDEVTCETTLLPSGGDQWFSVPSEVTTLDVVAIGGAGQPANSACERASGPASGGAGARVEATVAVGAGELLWATFPAVGSSTPCAGAGGSGTLLLNTYPSPYFPSSVLVGAGGGGGGGDSLLSSRGGDGGSAVSGSTTGGDGGGVLNTGGYISYNGGPGGSASGPGGNGGTPYGGAGQTGDIGGGGGGAGIHGGGGGGPGRCTFRLFDPGPCYHYEAGGGGGAGGSFAQAGSSPSISPSNEPQSLTIRYTVPNPMVTIGYPTEGAVVGLGEWVVTTFWCTSGPDGPASVSCVDSMGQSSPNGFLDTSQAGTFTYSVTGTNSIGVSRAASVSFTVNKGVPTITWPTPDPFTYGTALSAAQLNATASVPGTFSYSPASGVLPAGDHELSVTFTPTDTNNYETAMSSVTLTVLPAPLTVRAPDVTYSYGTPVPSLAPAYDGFVNGEDDSALTEPATCAVDAPDPAPVGEHPVICEGAVADNYAITYVAGTATVTPATLAITASDGRHYHGEPPPPITPIYDGFIVGEDESDLDQPPSCRSNTDATSDAGTYASTCEEASSTNYAITYAPGTVVVDRVPTSLTVDDVTVVGVLLGGLEVRHTAHLTSSRSGAGVAGGLIRFHLDDGTTLCTAATDAAGTATCVTEIGTLLDLLVGSRVATFDGGINYEPASGDGGVGVA